MKQVTIVQRVLMHYRIPIYERLPDRETEVSVYYGEAKGSLPEKSRCIYRLLFSIPIKFSFGAKQYFMPFYPQACFRILHERPDVLVLEGATNLANNLFLYPAGKLCGARIIWWDAGRRAGARPNLLRRLADPIINAMMRHADSCLAYSTLAKQYMIDRGVPAERIAIAYNTLDTEAIDSMRIANEKRALEIRSQLRLDGKRVIIYVGVIERRKRVELLVDAFARIRGEDARTELLIVGSGPHEEALQRYVLNKGTDGVHFLGRKVKDVGAYLLSSDIFVLPGEGGLGMVEAMAHSLPVVASSADGSELDLIEQGVNGFIVPEEDVDKMANAIRTILADPMKRKHFGRAARARIDGPYSVLNFVKTISAAINGPEPK